MPDELKTFEIETETGDKLEAVDKAVYEATVKEKSELEEKIKKLEEKDRNFKALRTKAEEADELKERLAKVEEQISARTASEIKREEAELESIFNEESNGDEERKKRLKYEYDQLNPALPKEERIARAKRLARDDEPASPIARAAASQGYGFVPKKNNDYADSDTGKALRQAMGLPSDEDIKK